MKAQLEFLHGYPVRGVYKAKNNKSYRIELDGGPAIVFHKEAHEPVPNVIGLSLVTSNLAESGPGASVTFGRPTPRPDGTTVIVDETVIESSNFKIEDARFPEGSEEPSNAPPPMDEDRTAPHPTYMNED